MIKKVKEGYRVESKKGRNIRTCFAEPCLLLAQNVGTYPTKEQAEKRLRQIEMFKHMKKG